MRGQSLVVLFHYDDFKTDGRQPVALWQVCHIGLCSCLACCMGWEFLAAAGQSHTLGLGLGCGAVKGAAPITVGAW